MKKFIPVNEPVIGEIEKKLVHQCLETGWISSEGPFVSAFEEAFCSRVSRKYGIACANGSAALDIALAALNLVEGDEVIMPTFTIISCAAAILRAGAKPVVVDADADTWNMDIDQVANAITSRTVAIMVVHIYGLPVDMNPILELARIHNLAIIEDAAELIGGTYNNTMCGSFGTISTFSFYPNKHITTGEGGMIVTDDPILAEKCKSYRNLCFTPETRFVHEELGWNYRMTNLQAALGLAQLGQLETFLEKKKSMGRYYYERLSRLETVKNPLLSTEYADNLFWVYGLVLQRTDMNAKEIMGLLQDKGIGCRPFFYPMHLQPVFKKRGMFADIKLPVSENLARNGFYIPSGLGLSMEDQEFVVDSLIDILE
jgi:perosamine synthetase